MALIGLNQQTVFPDPQNGQSPIDASVVRNNDNALVSKHNAHDADATIHVQTGTLAARPAAATPYAMYLDENKRLYVDDGVAWGEVPYARLDASGTNAFTSNVTVGGALGVTANATVGGTLGVTGLLTGGNLDVLDIDAANILATTLTVGGVSAGAVTTTSVSGNGSALTGITVAAPNVTAGTFGAGSYTVTGTLTAASLLTNGGTLRATRSTQSGAGGTANFATANHVRITMTGNGTITLSGGAAGGVYTVEVLQDGTGGRTVAWSSNVVWPSGVGPTSTTTPNRKDVFTFFYDGSSYNGAVFGQNFASTG